MTIVRSHYLFRVTWTKRISNITRIQSQGFLEEAGTFAEKCLTGAEGVWVTKVLNHGKDVISAEKEKRCCLASLLLPCSFSLVLPIIELTCNPAGKGAKVRYFAEHKKVRKWMCTNWIFWPCLSFWHCSLPCMFCPLLHFSFSVLAPCLLCIYTTQNCISGTRKQVTLCLLPQAGISLNSEALGLCLESTPLQGLFWPPKLIRCPLHMRS